MNIVVIQSNSINDTKDIPKEEYIQMPPWGVSATVVEGFLKNDNIIQKRQVGCHFGLVIILDQELRKSKRQINSE